MTEREPSRAGAADVSFVADLVPMAIDGLGLSGHDDHTERETADLRMLPVQTKRAALVLSELADAGIRISSSLALAGTIVTLAPASTKLRKMLRFDP